jgi:hypothetical protein
MRGMDYTGSPRLFPNLNDVEAAMSPGVVPTATGFKINTTNATVNDGAGVTYIYIDIRRGPMKVPTVGTSVFSPNAVNVSGGTTVTTGFPVDWQINYHRTVAANYNSANFNRLRGVSSNTTESGRIIWTAKADAEESFTGTLGWDNTGFKQTTNLFPNVDNIYWNFGRAPGFFDVVCYTGTGSATTQTHNLGAIPELLIIKTRSNAVGWAVSVGAVGYTNGSSLETDNAFSSEPNRITGTPTTTTFPIGTDAYVNVSARTYVAYLFATCAGVSKVGTYTGTGALQTINCGFAAGARFVLIKRTDSTGFWYTYDSARGMTSGNDPFLYLNSTDADVTGTNYVDTTAVGFQVTAAAPAGLNANGGTYIFLAIA